MTDDTVERKTLIGFILAVTLLVLVSTVAIFSVRGYGRSAREVAHSHEVIGELESVSASLSAAEAARRGYLATGESFYLDERDAALTKLSTSQDAVEKLTIDNPNQQDLLRQLRAIFNRRTQQSDAMILRAQTDGLEAAQKALKLQEVRQATLAANAKIEQIVAEEKKLLVARRGVDSFWATVLIVAFVVLLVIVTCVLGWLCLRIRTEMSERRRQSVALDRANSSLEAANRELEGFSYSVSHDLRSPLRAIDGYSLMLEEDYSTQLDDTARRYIQTIRGGCQRMAALIDDLLTFSRLSKQSLNRQTVDMTLLARRAAAEVLENQPEPRPVVEISDLPVIPGDPALLRQVWTNLIGNAVKYSAKSSAPTVNISGAKQGPVARFEVKDNGVGFDMKYADKLFGVFQRLHSAEEYPGTGVGLAIVQRIVARHEGAVTAHGERGKGATFGFTLPTEI